MSIVAAAGGADRVVDAVLAVVFLACVPVGIYLLRGRRFDPSDRLPPGRSAWVLLVAVAWGLLGFVTAQSAYVAYRVSTQPVTQPATAATTLPVRPVPPESNPRLADLPPRDVAFAATVPHMAAFLAVLTFDLVVYGGHLGRLGFAVRQLPRGVVLGVASAVVFIPLVFGGSVLTEWLYRALRYTHPDEHDLLHVLGQSGENWVQWAIVAGAVFGAPLAEELLFRGHIQTALRRALAGRGSNRGAEPIGASTPPRSWAVWGAIGITSAMFAAVHPMWTWPPIFLLSVFLGWLYERTGNLWAAVALHAMFNAVSTLFFLLSRGAN